MAQFPTVLWKQALVKREPEVLQTAAEAWVHILVSCIGAIIKYARGGGEQEKKYEDLNRRKCFIKSLYYQIKSTMKHKSRQTTSLILTVSEQLGKKLNYSTKNFHWQCLLRLPHYPLHVFQITYAQFYSKAQFKPIKSW